MQLINALTTQPDDVDFRIHLRNEFMRTGLIDIIEVTLKIIKKFAFVFQIFNFFRLRYLKIQILII